MTFDNRAIDTIQQSTGWITRQRWFGDKARPVTSTDVAFVQDVDFGHGSAALAIVRFSFEWGSDSLYFIPFISSDGATLDDAFANQDFLRWFVEGFAAGREMSGDATWSWRSMGAALPDLESVDYGNVRAISGEQSNTSIVFDRKFIGKMFRRVQPGLNPDLEIGEFLSVGDRFPHSPKLYGVVEVERNGEAIAIAAMQEFVPNVGDGWTWLLSQLETLSTGTHEAVLDAVRLLARRTAELHVALASDSQNDAFAPEMFDDGDARALIGRVIAEINDTVEGLAKHMAPQDVERIHKRMGDLMGVAHTMVGTCKIRVHGDYHLGQTLRTTDGDFMLIDFEGEPSRTMEQRRMKLPALKDVAGMIRSLDYAGATILQNESDPERRNLVTRWLAEATDAYVATYRDVATSASVAIVPEDDGLFSDVLDLMIAEKALYETRYELNNRPTWLPIPMNALRRLAGMDIPAEIE